MPAIVLLTGPAGSGKTTRLLEETAAKAKTLLTAEEQRILAMAYMHGARRRLEASLSEAPSCKALPRKITTIDGFSLDLVNRWRTALGLTWPVVPRHRDEDDQPPTERDFRTHCSFEQINQYAAQLLAKPMVASLVASSHPIVLIDEFQDCHGAKLAVVQALAKVTQVLVAADEFQVLDDIVGCPAIEWVQALDTGDRELCELEGCHRTKHEPILSAARALRTNVRLADETIPVYYGQPVQLVYRIMERLIPDWSVWTPKWRGSTAVIAPTHKAIASILKALAEQCEKQQKQPVHWVRHSGSEDDRAELFNALGINESSEGSYIAPDKTRDGRAGSIVAQAERFARLRGLKSVPTHLVSHFAEVDIHASRAYGHTSSFRVATTVHGAKNREFENVFIVWPYGVTEGEEKRRRLLYNAVTRARSNCVVLDMRSAAEIQKDPVMQLLGVAKPVFPPRKKAAKNTAKEKTKA